VVIGADLIERALEIEFQPGLTIHLWGISRSIGQIQLLPPNSDLAKLRESFERPSSRETISWEDGDTDDVLIRQRLAAFFKVSCRARTRGRSFRLTLPSDVVAQDLFRIQEHLVVSVVGSVVQLWRRDRWVEVTAISDVRQFVDAAADLLEESQE
jgi:hypothetical protein